ncbi:MAG: STM4013/SEN3800 family hydrolase [Pseudomonadales bacterium]|nr:STM4013/SEN3800 family hydrolase [Pseudomonadales bacterium]
MLDMNQIIGSHDLLLITLDTLRYDVARTALDTGQLPTLSRYITHWEQRHAPGSFTYSAHHALFAGFFPTPVTNPQAERLFALAFPGSETTAQTTCVLNAPNIIEGLAQTGYATVCIGGVGFFNQQTPLGCVFPNMFEKAYWSPELGVTHPDSTANQVTLALDILAHRNKTQPLLMFINVSAIHQPNHVYVDGETVDSIDTHAAALRYVDRQLAPLLEAFQMQRPTLVIICSDHGTAYGEDGYKGHRLAHEVVWTVPYAEFILGG